MVTNTRLPGAHLGGNARQICAKIICVQNRGTQIFQSVSSRRLHLHCILVLVEVVKAVDWTTMRFLLTAAVGALAIVFTAAEPDGFDERTIVKASFMTDIAFMPKSMGDLMFVTRKVGIINVYEPDEDYDYGNKVEALDISDDVCDNSERGLGSIQVHPNFEVNNWV